MDIKVRIEKIDILKVFPNTWNPNKQSDFIFDKEKESIIRFGMIDPITVREIPEGYEIIDGEHRWKACKELGMPQIPVNNLGEVSDSVAKQLTIVFNETKGKYDRLDMSSLIQDILKDVGEVDLKAVMPFSDFEFDAFAKVDAIDWSAQSSEGTSLPAEPGSPGDDEWKTVEYRLPEAVADQLEAQITRFKKALHPDDDINDVSPVQAIEAICQTLAQIEDERLI